MYKTHNGSVGGSPGCCFQFQFVSLLLLQTEAMKIIKEMKARLETNALSWLMKKEESQETITFQSTVNLQTKMHCSCCQKKKKKKTSAGMTFGSFCFSTTGRCHDGKCQQPRRFQEEKELSDPVNVGRLEEHHIRVMGFSYHQYLSRFSVLCTVRKEEQN